MQLGGHDLHGDVVSQPEGDPQEKSWRCGCVWPFEGRPVFAKRRGSNMFMGSSLPPANTSESDKDVNLKKWSAVEGLGKNRNLFLWRLRGADKSRSPTSCVPSRHPSGKHLATSQRVGSMVRRLTRSQAITKHPKVKVNSKTHVLGPFG